jgi:Haloacid dehalogenase-like hydrolase
MRRTVLLDLDGTIYARGRLIPGAGEAVASLRARDVALRFLTNVDSRTPAELLIELRGWGLDILPDELFSPVVAAVLYLSKVAVPRVYPLVSNSLQPVFQRFRGEGRTTHVVVGDCRDVLTYQLLDNAFRVWGSESRSSPFSTSASGHWRGRRLRRFAAVADGRPEEADGPFLCKPPRAGEHDRHLGIPGITWFWRRQVSPGARTRCQDLPRSHH